MAGLKVYATSSENDIGAGESVTLLELCRYATLSELPFEAFRPHIAWTRRSRDGFRQLLLLDRWLLGRSWSAGRLPITAEMRSGGEVRLEPINRDAERKVGGLWVPAAQACVLVNRQVGPVDA